MPSRASSPLAPNRDLGTAHDDLMLSCQVCKPRYPFQTKGLQLVTPSRHNNFDEKAYKPRKPPRRVLLARQAVER